MTPDTIYAHSSGSPPAAIAVIRISGPEAFAAGNALAGSLPPPGQFRLRKLRDTSGELLDEALVLTFRAPHSATGEDVVELHCHGSRATAKVVQSALSRIPTLRQAQPGEFTRRALENGRMDLGQAEALADLLSAETEAQRRHALLLLSGDLQRLLNTWRTQIVELSAIVEAAIDYVGDDDETALDIRHVARRARAIQAEMARKLQQPRADVLRDGIRIVIAGPVNSGKSSLINALSGQQKAITSDVPGTTRDVIEATVAFMGLPFVLADTAGLRPSEDPIERIGVERANQEVQSSDLLLWLGSPDTAPDHRAAILVHTKIDLPERRAVPHGSIGVSSKSGEGLSDLVTRIVALSRDRFPAANEADLNQRQANDVAAASEALEAITEDALLAAECLRCARTALDRATGHAGMEDVLDALFGRFCLGK